MPLPSSATDTATWTPCLRADTRITDDSGECLAAFDSRLLRTWTMRGPSAITGGKSEGSSTRTLSLPHAVMNVFFASSTRMARSAGPGETDRAPVSMRATSSRSLISPRILSAWSKIILWNWRISAGSRVEPSSSRVLAEPLMDVRGVLSSWLTIPRNSARRSCSSSSGVMS